ncbi:hypothetical protein HPB50_004104 [Hyalomma asiaticum]|uniref:Uncharacterized protein n=1 Tax=Hyalomma asiaticum TaxID=266040 RepID=A0ACB7TBS3_HYAAI|nr:hypothetical protein HPB50_004104 [Hyalomma asiaticum]
MTRAPVGGIRKIADGCTSSGGGRLHQHSARARDSETCRPAGGDGRPVFDLTSEPPGRTFFLSVAQDVESLSFHPLHAGAKMALPEGSRWQARWRAHAANARACEGTALVYPPLTFASSGELSARLLRRP